MTSGPASRSSDGRSRCRLARSRRTRASRRTGRYVDLLQAGIVDSTKVVRIALENAVSVAGILLLTEATMTEIAEEPKNAAPAASHELEGL